MFQPSGSSNHIVAESKESRLRVLAGIWPQHANNSSCPNVEGCSRLGRSTEFFSAYLMAVSIIDSLPLNTMETDTHCAYRNRAGSKITKIRALWDGMNFERQSKDVKKMRAA